MYANIQTYIKREGEGNLQIMYNTWSGVQKSLSLTVTLNKNPVHAVVAS